MGGAAPRGGCRARRRGRALAALAVPGQPDDPGGRALRPRPAAAFLHPDSGAACLVSALVPAAPPDDPRDTARAVRAYAREVREALSARKVDQGAFRVGGWSVTQLRIVGPGEVVYRLLLSAPRRPPVQLDYLLPAAAFREEVVKLESSIGSIAGAE